MTFSADPAKYSPLELLEKLSFTSSREQFSPLGESPYVLLPLSEPGGAEITQTDLQSLTKILDNLACPVIGLNYHIGINSNSQNSCEPICEPLLAAHCDVVLDKEADCKLIIDNINNAPITAMTLVQLLRHNERTSIDDGLLAESLAYASLQGGSEFDNFMRSRNVNKPTSRHNDKKTSDKKTSDKKTNDKKTNEPAVLVFRDTDMLHITFNRPANRNAFSMEMRDAFIDALQLLESDSSLKKAIVDGAGSCFCIGGDLAEFGLAQNSASAHAIRSTRSAARLLAAMAERLEFNCHSACIGSGIEMPAFASRLIAKPKSFFQLPEITMGLIPGAGGTVSIPRRIGRQRTAYMALSAKKIKAETALKWGLIDELS